VLFVVKFLLAFMIIGASGIAREAITETEFKNHLKWAQENFAATQKKIATLQQEETSSCSSQKCSLNNIQILAGNNPTNQESSEKETEKILVFVSFSMPAASLKTLAQEAEKANAVLIIRGLIEDSFKVTMTRLKDCALSAEINPDLFEKYNIQHVPTFVRLKGDKEQARLSGNVTLRFAVQKFEETP